MSFIWFSDDPVQRKGNHLEQREKLGLSSGHTERTNSRTPPSEPTNALQKVEVRRYNRSSVSKIVLYNSTIIETMLYVCNLAHEPKSTYYQNF